MNNEIHNDSIVSGEQLTNENENHRTDKKKNASKQIRSIDFE